MERNFKVAKSEAGERIDKWLCKKMPNASRNQIKKLINGGKVLVNKRRVVIAGWKLDAGDDVVVKGPVLQSPLPPRERVRERGVCAISTSRIKIYHEDRDIIVVEKPVGIISSPADKSEVQRDTMLGRVQGYLRRKHGGKASFVAAMHRLDAQTSGVMVFALSKIGQRLEDQFRRHTIRREYTAIVMGRIEKSNGVINAPLEKGEFGYGRKVAKAQDGQGKEAVTEFSVKERYLNATLLNIRVRTGRTHQIRVHLAGIDHPLVGDTIYGSEHEVAVPIEFKRQALHAHMLGFHHPANGKKMAFSSNLPTDMKDLIDQLRQ